MDLRVSLQELHVAQTVLVGLPARFREHPGGQIHAEDAAAARPPSGGQRRPTAPAADVEDAIGRHDRGGLEERRVVAGHGALEGVAVGRPVLALVAVPRAKLAEVAGMNVQRPGR
jgi:hypothetical protein